MAMTAEALLADLRATYPGIHARPLREYGLPEWTEGVWFGDDGTLEMPDGFPVIYPLACADPEHYDGQLHHAFIAWLKHRGYDAECYDHGTYFIVAKAGGR